MKGTCRKIILILSLTGVLSSCAMINVEQRIKDFLYDTLEDDAKIINNIHLEDKYYVLVQGKKHSYLVKFTIGNNIVLDQAVILEQNRLYYGQFQTMGEAYVLICGNNQMGNMAGFELEMKNHYDKTMTVSREIAYSSAFMYVYPCDFSMSLTNVYAYDLSGTAMEEPILIEGLPIQGGD